LQRRFEIYSFIPICNLPLHPRSQQIVTDALILRLLSVTSNCTENQLFMV